MKLKYFIFSLVIPFFPTAFAFAWSATGHGIVGDIAYKHLSPLAQSRVAYYLKGRSVHLACTWMDSVKSIRAYSYLTQRHYLNLDKGVTYDTTSTNDVVFELKRVIEQLSNRGNLSDSLITQYVLEVFHLVGDIHQPLHGVTRVSAAHPDGDRGGNLVLLNHNRLANNLHAYWDKGGGLFASQDYKRANEVKKIARRLERQWVCYNITEFDPMLWANESHTLAVNTAYVLPADNNPDKQYQQTAKDISAQRVALAGCRLANLLNSLCEERSDKAIQ